jgi:hypothetical protein
MTNSTNKLILPKPHCSWSQINCWMSNPERFRREYFENSAKLDTKFLQYGKGIAKLIESGKHKELLPGLIVYDVPEFEIRTELQGIPLLSYLDSYDPALNVFREVKTGKIPWTQSKVQKHDQLTFYATALKLKTGKMPEYCDLDWLETKEGIIEVDDFWRENEKLIQVTGRIVTFHREFDEREVERMENLIVKCAEEISEAYIKFIDEI